MPKYLVLGLGDVYLGAPVATPVDPRHRLVTTKYNPARTWTAGELRRHRRRVPVHLRHGGAGRLPVRRPHHPGLEPLPQWRVWQAQGSVRRAPVVAAVLRPDRVVPGQRREAAGPARGDRGRARACRGDRGLVRLRLPTPVPGRERRRRSSGSGSGREGRSRRRRSGGGPRASSTGRTASRGPVPPRWPRSPSQHGATTVSSAVHRERLAGRGCALGRGSGAGTSCCRWRR